MQLSADFKINLSLFIARCLKNMLTLSSSYAESKTSKSAAVHLRPVTRSGPVETPNNVYTGTFVWE